MPVWGPARVSNPITIVGTQLMPTVISLNSPASVQVGAPFAISGSLRTDAGAPMAGAAVDIVVAQSALGALGTVVTDSQGNFAASLTISAEGNYAITASFAGGSNYLASAKTNSVTASIAPPPAPISVWVIIGAAAAALLLVVGVSKRK